MPERLNQLLAKDAAALVHGNFTDVEGEWWWERRLGGGIAVCQELDPHAMSRQISERKGLELQKVRQTTRETLELDDMAPVVLTFEIPGDATTAEAARILQDRSSEPEGLAAAIYRRIEKAVGG